MLDINLDARQGQALLAATAAHHGEALGPAARHLSRLFLIRSPWAPGLRFVGGQAAYDGAAPISGEAGSEAVLCDPRVFSLSGPAETLEASLASCIGEGIELLSQIERLGDVRRAGTVAAMASLSGPGSGLLPGTADLIAAHLHAQDLAVETPLAWMIGRRLVTQAGAGPASPSAGDEVLVPADWCVRRSPARTTLVAPWPLGSGVAAGPTWAWAATRALLELIERDAAGLWWRGGRRGRAIALDHPAAAEAARLASSLRQGQTERQTWLLDITTDIGVPVVAALSSDAGGPLSGGPVTGNRGFVCGFGARLTLEAAVRAALLECAQMELALLLALAKQRELPESLNDRDISLLQRAAILDTAQCDLLHPAGPPLPHAAIAAATVPRDDEADLVRLSDVLDRRGIAAALVTLTRPALGLPVVRAIAPQLQPMPSTHCTDRLQRIVDATGGGDRFTNGVQIF